MAKRIFITTIDNPNDPSTDFKSWFIWDIEHGYNTCQYLDNLAVTSSSLSDNTNLSEIESAIDEIIRINGSEVYKKIVIDDGKSEYVE